MLDDSFEYDNGVPCSQPVVEDADGYRIVWGASTTSILKELAVPERSKPARSSASVEALLNGTFGWKADSAVGSVKRSSVNADLASPTRLSGTSHGLTGSGRYSKRRRRFPTASQRGDGQQTDIANGDFVAMYNELQRRLDAREQLNAAAATMVDDNEDRAPASTLSTILIVNKQHNDESALADDTLRMSQGMAAIQLAMTHDRPVLAPKFDNNSRVFGSPRQCKFPTPMASQGTVLQSQKQRTLDTNAERIVKFQDKHSAHQPQLVDHKPPVPYSIRSTQVVAESHPQSSKSASTTELRKAVTAAAMPTKKEDDDDALYWHDNSMEREFEIALSQIPLDQEKTTYSSNADGPAQPAASASIVSEEMLVSGPQSVEAADDKPTRQWTGFERRDRRPSNLQQPASQAKQVHTGSQQDLVKPFKLSSKPLYQHTPLTEVQLDLSKKISPRSVSLNNINMTSTHLLHSRLGVRAQSAHQVSSHTLSVKSGVVSSSDTAKPTVLLPSRASSHTNSTNRNTSHTKMPGLQSAKTHKAFKPPSIVRPDKADAARAKVVQTKAAVKAFTPKQVDLAAYGIDETFEFNESDLSF